MAAASDHIDTLREFTRFYTRRLGVLHEGLLQSRFSLTEARVLWEFAHRERCTATELAAALELDPGYLSRLLRRLREQGLVKATRSTDDARHQHLSITAAGRRAFAPLDARSRDEAATLLARLAEPQQQRLIDALVTARMLLDDAPRASVPAVLRAHRAGDIGWVVSRHGALYTQEFHWDLRFEALVARIAADFIDRFEPTREACWIAERDGTRLGCVFLVQARDEASGAPIEGVAQLRLLLVEPAARGEKLGASLVAQCTHFARAAGYRKIMLWTNNNLLAARAIYRKAGYALLRSEQHHSFGHDLVGEIWELALE